MERKKRGYLFNKLITSLSYKIHYIPIQINYNSKICPMRVHATFKENKQNKQGNLEWEYVQSDSFLCQIY